MVVRPFYYVKLFQALGTCILLWQLLSITGQFCGYFIPPNNLLQLASPVGPCNNFTLYQMPLNATHQPQLKHTHLRQTPLSGAHKAFADQMLSESFPTGPHCFEVGHAQTFWGIDNWHKHTGPFEHTANGLLFPLFFGSLYVIVLVIHTALQVPPDYNTAEVVVVVLGFFGWYISIYRMGVLVKNWCSIWRCTNFRPDVSLFTPLCLAFVLTVSLALSCIAELWFEHKLKKLPVPERKASANGQRRGGVAKGKGADAKGKNEFFTIDVSKNGVGVLRV